MDVPSDGARYVGRHAARTMVLYGISGLYEKRIQQARNITLFSVGAYSTPSLSTKEILLGGAVIAGGR